jgi:hypothetical protein
VPRQTAPRRNVETHTCDDEQERDEIRDAALARLKREGKNWQAAQVIVQQAVEQLQRSGSKDPLYKLNLDRERKRKRLDSIRGSWRTWSQRLARYIEETTPPEVREMDRMRVRVGDKDGVIHLGTGRVLRGIRELDAALADCPTLSLSSSEINSLHPFRGRIGPPSKKALLDDTRTKLQNLGIDKLTITDLLWVAGLSKSAPPR